MPNLKYALATGAFIAAYSVVDGIGVRLSGNALSYTAWMSTLWGGLMPALYIALRDSRSLLRWRPGLPRWREYERAGWHYLSGLYRRGRFAP